MRCRCGFWEMRLRGDCEVEEEIQNYLAEVKKI